MNEWVACLALALTIILITLLIIIFGIVLLEAVLNQPTSRQVRRRAVWRPRPRPPRRRPEHEPEEFEDRHNVHDQYLNIQLGEKLALIVEKNKELDLPQLPKEDLWENTIVEVRELLNNSDTEVTAALETLNTIKQGGIISSNIAQIPYGDEVDERQILTEVWLRIHSPDNASNVVKLRSAMLHELDSAVEDGSVQCTSGRVSRVLDSLLMLDADPEIAKPVATLRIIKKEMNHKMPLLIDEMLEKMSEEFQQQYQRDEYNADVYNFHKAVVNAAGEYMKETYPDLPNKFQAEILGAIERSFE